MKIGIFVVSHHPIAIMKDAWNILLYVPPLAPNAKLGTSWSKATASSYLVPSKTVSIALGVKYVWSVMRDSPSKTEYALNILNQYPVLQTVLLVMVMDNAPNVWMGINPIRGLVSVNSRIVFDAWEMPFVLSVLSQPSGQQSMKRDVVQSFSLKHYARLIIVWCVRLRTCALNAVSVLTFSLMVLVVRFLVLVTRTAYCVTIHKLSASSVRKDSSLMSY